MSNYYYLEDLARESGMDLMAAKYYRNIGLIKPARAGGAEDGAVPHLHFDENALKRLKTIKRLRRSDTSIRQIIAMMRKEE